MFGVNLGSLIIHLRANAIQFERTLMVAEQRLAGTAKKLQTIGRTMMKFVTLPLAAIGVFALKVFGDFDQAMTESLAIMGEVSDEMRAQMEGVAKTIALISVTAARDLAEAYFFLASAGLDAAQSMGVLGTVEKFAVAGAFSMASATDLLTDAQTALGLSTKNVVQNQHNMTRVSDVLVKANTLANASVEQFSRALTNKAASALRLLNKDVEEGVAVLAAFADQGRKGVEAGEALNIMSRDLQRSAINNIAVWKKMGMSVFDNRGKMLSYADIIGQLEQKFSRLSDQQMRATAMQLGFQDRSFSSIQMLIGTSQKIREYERALRDASGITEEVSKKQLKSFNSQMRILWNNIKNVAGTIGGFLAPSVLKLGRQIRQGVAWWNDLNRETQQAIVYYGAVAAAIGPVLLGLGLLTKVMGFALGGLSSLIKFGMFGFKAVAIAVMSVTLPFNILIATIALVGAAIGGVVGWLIGVDGLVSAWNISKVAAVRFFQGVIGFMSNFLENMKIQVRWLRENWEAVFFDIGQIVVVSLTNMVINFQVVLKTMINLFMAFGGALDVIFENIFSINFVNTLVYALADAAVLIQKWGDNVWKWIVAALTGQDLNMDDLMDEFLGSAIRGATAPKDIFSTMRDIIQEGAKELRSPLVGFESALKGLPKFNLTKEEKRELTLQERAEMMRSKDIPEMAIRRILAKEARMQFIQKTPQNQARMEAQAEVKRLRQEKYQARQLGATETTNKILEKMQRTLDSSDPIATAT